MQYRTTTMKENLVMPIKFTRYHGRFFLPRSGQQAYCVSPFPPPFNLGCSPLRVPTLCMCILLNCGDIKAYSLVSYPQEGTKTQFARLLRPASVSSSSRHLQPQFRYLNSDFQFSFGLFPLEDFPSFVTKSTMHFIKILPPPFSTVLSAL